MVFFRQNKKINSYKLDIILKYPIAYKTTLLHMNKSLIINTLALCFTLSFAQAQNVSTQSLAGFWRISNTADAKAVSSFLRIIPLENNLFVGSYLSNGTKIELAGSVFEPNQIYAIEGANQEKSFTFDGIMQSDYSISGNYLDGGSVTGQFVWEKICDDLGNAIDLNSPPCLEKTTTFKTETRMVKKLIQVADTVTTRGETRDENIPLAETIQDIPADAIIVGHIGFDETVAYKTVEIEVPEQVVVTEETEKEKQFAVQKNTVQETETAKVTVKKPTIKMNKEAISNSKIVSSSAASSKPLPTSFEMENMKMSAPNKASATKIAESFTAATKKVNTVAPTKVPASYNSNASQAEIEAAKKAKLQSCDTPVADASVKIAQMVRGTKAEENGRTYHIVGSGETMTAISKLYNISIVQLAELNKKDCERIFVGEKLLVK